jgi:hypothetical protein
MRIEIDLTKEQAAAVLEFLRRIDPAEVRHRRIDVETFTAASIPLRMALRDVVEPARERGVSHVSGDDEARRRPDRSKSLRHHPRCSDGCSEARGQHPIGAEDGLRSGEGVGPMIDNTDRNLLLMECTAAQ